MIAIRERLDIVRSFGLDEAFAPVDIADFGFWTGFAASSPAFDLGGPLTVLRGVEVSRRFHGWRGQSGRRYVCTVFGAAEEALAFAEAVVIAVARGSDGLPCPVGAIEIGAFPDDDAVELFCHHARVQGASEWHVHLLAANEAARRNVLKDLQADRAG